MLYLIGFVLVMFVGWVCLETARDRQNKYWIEEAKREAEKLSSLKHGNRKGK